jgi:hypothetical protein
MLFLPRTTFAVELVISHPYYVAMQGNAIKRSKEKFHDVKSLFERLQHILSLRMVEPSFSLPYRLKHTKDSLSLCLG